MKRLHLECYSGASGDMLLGALVDLGAPIKLLNDSIAKLGLAGLKLVSDKVSKSGIGATKVRVEITSERKLKHWPEVEKILEHAPLSEFVREKSLQAMLSIAQAEAKIHSCELKTVHFHELGSLDTIADMVGVFSAVEFFKPDIISASAIGIGSGTVKIEHGVLPNPAPATLEILRGLTIDATPLAGERTTPTGAAILAALVERDYLPVMSSEGESVEAIGYGAGQADFSDRVNVLRATLFEKQTVNLSAETICQMETTIDDMNPQLFGRLFERMYDAGALEAFITPVTMKKTRPGWNLTVLCRVESRQKLSEIILIETTSTGVRYQALERVIAPRRMIEVETKFGLTAVKCITVGKRTRFQPEYDSCLALAHKTTAPLAEIMDAARTQAEREFGNLHPQDLRPQNLLPQNLRSEEEKSLSEAHCAGSESDV